MDVVVSEDHEKRTSPMSKMRTDVGVVGDMKMTGGESNAWDGISQTLSRFLCMTRFSPEIDSYSWKISIMA